jgi:hypothetical protein
MPFLDEREALLLNNSAPSGQRTEPAFSIEKVPLSAERANGTVPASLMN